MLARATGLEAPPRSSPSRLLARGLSSLWLLTRVLRSSRPGLWLFPEQVVRGGRGEAAALGNPASTAAHCDPASSSVEARQSAAHSHGGELGPTLEGSISKSLWTYFKTTTVIKARDKLSPYGIGKTWRIGRVPRTPI